MLARVVCFRLTSNGFLLNKKKESLLGAKYEVQYQRDEILRVLRVV